MSVLLFVVIGVIVLFAILGYRKGLLGILFNIFSWIFIALFVIIVNPYIYNFIVQQTSWQNTISSTTSNYVNGVAEKITGSASGSTQSEGDNSVTSGDIEGFLSQYGVTVPKDLLNDITNEISNGVDGATNAVSDQVNQVKNSVVSGITNTVTSYILRGLACLIAFVIAKIICMIVYAIVRYLQDAPVIHGICSWIGMVLGAVKGLFITWLFMFVVSLTAATKFGQFFLPMIEKSQFLTFLYENNLIIYLFYYFF
ncbi:MAG: CvpA family protein [Lachnospiraceae bacterium]|nr:CvpA family protein [Lachnospiraceae bacterium]